jgi:hypothetical protein
MVADAENAHVGDHETIHVLAEGEPARMEGEHAAEQERQPTDLDRAVQEHHKEEDGAGSLEGGPPVRSPVASDLVDHHLALVREQVSVDLRVGERTPQPTSHGVGLVGQRREEAHQLAERVPDRFEGPPDGVGGVLRLGQQVERRECQHEERDALLRYISHRTSSSVIQPSWVGRPRAGCSTSPILV